MAKSHKTCMEQAEIIDTFGTYQLLQMIVRRNSNRSNIFNNFVTARQISTTRLLRELRKIKFICLTIEFNRNFTFLAIYYSSTSSEKRSTENNRTKTIPY